MSRETTFVSVSHNPDVHDARGFHSSVTELDTWLREHATAAARSGVARTFVWTPEDSAVVVAYYALSAHAVPRSAAPSRIGRGVPDPVPAALISKLALDRKWHGQRWGDVLLADALTRILAASHSGPAVRAIVVDAATDAGQALYRRFGFQPAPGRADRLIAHAETIAAALAHPPNTDR